MPMMPMEPANEVRIVLAFLVLRLLKLSERAVRNDMEALPMFLCCGRQDALVYDMCSRFADFARKEGLPLTYLEGEGQHDIPFWDGMLEPAFRFMTQSH